MGKDTIVIREIDYKVFGYSSSYSVDKTQNIKVKL